VFLSWSGEESRKVAEALYRWLPHFIQAIQPWMSPTDILAGARWQTEIASRLDNCFFGIICTTPRNIESPWMLFEAGALSKSIQASRVVPFLLGVEVHHLPQALSQFQAVEADRVGVLSLLHSLNGSLNENKLTPTQLDTAFEKFYGELENDLSVVRKDIATQREARFRVIENQVERTKAIVNDLQALRDSTTKGGDRVYVRYSGFLSPFAISDDEILQNKLSDSKTRVDYFEQLKRERDLMVELARDERFVIRCIITPPTSSHVPLHIRKNTKMRLERLREFLGSEEGKQLRIDWVISRFQQKNTYIIGSLSYFEGLKQGAEEGYRFTLRYAGAGEMEINTAMYDLLFHRLVISTLTSYEMEALEERDGLREATLKCVTEALSEIERQEHEPASASQSVSRQPKRRSVIQSTRQTRP